MFKNNLVCGSAIAIMLLTNLAPVTQIKADAAALSQAGSKAINTVYDLSLIHISEPTRPY